MTPTEPPKWVGRRTRERQAQDAADLRLDNHEVGLLVAAARRILLKRGVEAITVREVLAQTNLGTRAFYRHFASRDELVLAVFTVAAYREAERLTRKMATASDPVGAVVAWIDGRLDLAFDQKVSSSGRDLSIGAQLGRPQTPAELELPLNLMLAPLIEQLEAGRSVGLFQSSDPVRDAHSIHDVIWGVVQRHWLGTPMGEQETRHHVTRFCLRAVGADRHGASVKQAH